MPSICRVDNNSISTYAMILTLIWLMILHFWIPQNISDFIPLYFYLEKKLNCSKPDTKIESRVEEGGENFSLHLKSSYNMILTFEFRIFHLQISLVTETLKMPQEEDKLSWNIQFIKTKVRKLRNSNNESRLSCKENFPSFQFSHVNSENSQIFNVSIFHLLHLAMSVWVKSEMKSEVKVIRTWETSIKMCKIKFWLANSARFNN